MTQNDLSFDETVDASAERMLADRSREEALHRFIRDRRLALAPEATILGARPRLPSRIGKRVTQEEVAEHLGISRQWYARFESGTVVGFSTQLLRRLSDLLVLSAADHARLMALALPALAPSVSLPMTELHDALCDVRRTVKRFWQASSEAEIFQIAREAVLELLPDFELSYGHRGLLATGENDVAIRPGANAAFSTRFTADLLRRLSSEQIAEVDALWRGTAAGDLVSYETYPSFFVQPLRHLLQRCGIVWESLATAHILGSNGTAGIVGAMSTRPHQVTELERAALSSIASLASLALR